MESAATLQLAALSAPGITPGPRVIPPEPRFPLFASDADIARLFRQAFTLLAIQPKIVLRGSSGAIGFTV